MTGIEILKEILRLLKITKEYTLDKNRTTEPAILEEMSTASATTEIVQTVIPKSMVPDLKWFDEDWMKFKD